MVSAPIGMMAGRPELLGQDEDLSFRWPELAGGFFDAALTDIAANCLYPYMPVGPRSISLSPLVWNALFQAKTRQPLERRHHVDPPGRGGPAPRLPGFGSREGRGLGPHRPAAGSHEHRDVVVPRVHEV